ncbi:LacI family DNA-binding transcriptional regulator [Pseudogracilibacillus auburnensis]|uniref:LacI family DNA-binding transcriptional regulator n=1 Tax=Pseudogracilibacillus auburnensis TaxID=1494959 RepID=UPI001A965453|nr:LacI family DNA-binding transcriptional regulator [Pseudogracilibacillus auburnensis]MBO1004008.1 LacI family DNA-binding transcriptional regulator [Pseudogracilibacillus auburnensis]
MATLRDVAKRAGVSVSTASYSINNSPLITDKTKKKVLQAVKELGYRPHGMAKNLKEQKTNIIGIFLSGFSGPFFNEMLEGIQEVVIQNGYELVVCASVDQHRLLIERYVDGAIILNFHMEDELLESCANEKFPIITLDREMDDPHIQNVLLPNEDGSALIVDYLIDKGHKRIGYISGSEESFDGEMRLKGFKNSLQRHGKSLLDMDLLRADFTESSGYEKMNRYLNEERSDLPSAFVCANDEMALGAIRAIQEHGIRIPEDIAIAGFDDIHLSEYINPPLTTIHVPKKQWGITAAQTLFNMIDDSFGFEPVPIELVLKIRDSA